MPPSVWSALCLSLVVLVQVTRPASTDDWRKVELSVHGKRKVPVGTGSPNHTEGTLQAGGYASSDPGDATYSHPSVNSDHGDTAYSHPSANIDHGDTDYSHPSANSDLGDIIYSHPSANSDHGDTAYSHPSANSDHGDTAYSHPSANSDHGDTAYSHSSANSDHGDTAYSHPSANSDHGDTAYSHPSANSDHGDTAYSHPSANSALGDTAYRYPLGNSDRGDTTYKYPSANSDHGDTAYSHPSANSDLGDKAYSRPSANSDLGDTAYRYPSANSDHGDTAYRYPSANSDHGDTGYSRTSTLSQPVWPPGRLSVNAYFAQQSHLQEAEGFPSTEPPRFSSATYGTTKRTSRPLVQATLPSILTKTAENGHTNIQLPPRTRTSERRFMVSSHASEWPPRNAQYLSSAFNDSPGNQAMVQNQYPTITQSLYSMLTSGHTGEMPRKSVSAEERRSSRQPDAAKKAFTPETSSSSHRTTESPAVVPLVENTKSTMGIDTAVNAKNTIVLDLPEHSNNSTVLVTPDNSKNSTVLDNAKNSIALHTAENAKNTTVLDKPDNANNSTVLDSTHNANNSVVLDTTDSVNSSTVLDTAENAKNTIVVDTAEIMQCVLDPTDTTKEFWIDSDPSSLAPQSLIVNVRNVNPSNGRYKECEMKVTAPAGRLMSVGVADLDCNPAFENQFLFMVTDTSSTSSVFNSQYCTQPRKNLILYITSSANFYLSFIAESNVEGFDLTVNFTALPELHWVLPVEYTSRLKGSVTTPGWDGVTSLFLMMDTWVSVALPAGHEVMVSVFQFDRPANSDQCSVNGYLALYEEYPDADPLQVYCIKDIPAPVALNSSSGKLIVRFSVGQASWFSKGFKLHFSFHPPSAKLSQLSDGTWNCSVPNWSEFQHHFPCNFHAECAGGEDEAACPYTTAHCGAGRLDLAGSCYLYIPAQRNESDSLFLLPTMSWNMAEEKCRREGGNLASLNSYRERKEVFDFAHSIDPGMFFFIGLVPIETSLPHLYRHQWTYLDGTIALFTGPVTVYKFIETLTHLDPGRYNTDGAMINSGNVTTVMRDIKFPHSSALCEIPSPEAHHYTPDDGRGGGVDAASDPLLPTVNLTFHHIASVACPGHGHITHTFLACDAHSACWARAFGTSVSCKAPVTPLPPSMTCDNGVQSVPYTLVCDGRPDCSDLSDENFCVFAPCDISKEIACSDITCLPIDNRCDGVQDCLDAIDERGCASQHVFTNPPATPPPAALNFNKNGGVYFTQLVTDNETNRTGAHHSPSCPDTHFQCAVNDYCVPVFTRCNDAYDCPGHEDEAGCDSYTCPGFYRCRGSRICLHEDYVCDAFFHCPQGDDESFCNIQCPAGCTCYGLAFVCPASTPVALYSRLRYLDASGSGMNMTDVKNNSWLIYLSLVHCGVRDWAQLILPNLRSLDLTQNSVTSISAQELEQLPNLRHLALGHNPLTSFMSHPMTSSSASFLSLRSLDFSSVPLIDVSVLKIFPHLHVLNLTGCGINRLPQDGFQTLTLLRVLDVRGCPLEFFSRSVFQGLDDLTDVYADNYKLCCPATLPGGFNPMNCEAPINEVSSCESLLRTSGFRICLCAFSILACSGNTFSLIFRILSSKGKFKTGFDIFVAVLCVSDFLMGVYLAVIGVADYIYLGTYLWEDRTWRHSTACKIAGFVSLLSNEVSALMISLITLDRFLVLRFPFRQFRFTTSTALLASGVCWVIGLAIATVPLLPWNSDWQFYSQVAICIPLPITRQDFAGHDYAFSVMIVLNFVLFVFIAIGQCLVYTSVQTHKMPTHTQSSTALNKDRALARRLITVAASDFLCWFPIGLVAIMAAHGFPVPGQVNVAMAVFVMPLNSAINPFLCTFNIVLEKRRLLQEKRFKQLMLSQVKFQSAQSGPSALAADKFSSEKALCHLSLWLQTGILSRNNVTVCLEEGSSAAARPKFTFDDVR